jgi:predicted RNA-binding protein
MKYWLFMFRPDTYLKVQEHQTIGVRESVRKRFAEVKKGDRFVVYVSRAKLLDGYGEVTSDPYEEDTLIFSNDQVYFHRAKVRFDRVGAAVPAGDELWGMAPFQENLRTEPTNLILCKGGFIEISKDDYEHVLGLTSVGRGL